MILRVILATKYFHNKLVSQYLCFNILWLFEISTQLGNVERTEPSFIRINLCLAFKYLSKCWWRACTTRIFTVIWNSNWISASASSPRQLVAIWMPRHMPTSILISNLRGSRTVNSLSNTKQLSLFQILLLSNSQ